MDTSHQRAGSTVSRPRSHGSTPAWSAFHGRWILVASVFLLSTLLLFLGLYRNQWNVVREKKFKEFQMDSESLVIARMVETRQTSLLSENGLLGWGDANPLDLNESDYLHQYDVYLSGGRFNTYSLYKSVSGFQGLFFSTLDRLSPNLPAINLRNFRALEALLFALSLSVFVLWVFKEFGWLTAVFLLITTLLSQWITLFGRNLFYFIWASFLPLGTMCFYLARERRSGRTSNIALALVAFGAVLFKCLMNGYDFIIPALSMPIIPVVYYGLRSGPSLTTLLGRVASTVAALAAAIAASMLILATQLQVSEGSLLGGLTSIFSTFGRRTYADPTLFPSYAESLRANPWSVLWTYISEDTAVQVLRLRFLDVIIFFALISVAYLILGALRSERLPDRTKAHALMATTWLSILSPVSWFLIFKGQAYVHTFTNYLAWHMPFTLFGYTMCMFLVQSMLRAILRPPAERRAAG
jgi:hypothetical protein